MSPDQIQSIKSWAVERDEWLAKISALKVEYDNLFDLNAQAGIVNSDLGDQIQHKKGQLKILEDTDKDRCLLVSKEVSDLLVQKTELQISNGTLESDNQKLRTEHDKLVDDLSKLMPVYERVTWQIAQLTETVNKVVTTNANSTKEVNILVEGLRKILSAYSE